MRKFKYKQDNRSYFYAEPITDGLLIISIGHDNPFLHLDVLWKAIHENSSETTEVINLYFDLLSCIGNNPNRFYFIKYDLTIDRPDFSSAKYLDNTGLSDEIKDIINKLYKSKINEIIDYSVLTKREKENILASAL
ncbi:MAG: type II toxin-antitoxin system RnlB family antitoxin [Nitrospirae bacterium]|nr:type II toxin-antitoxin system RnlB family antitoxin [Nitrospirota bacterium]